MSQPCFLPLFTRVRGRSVLGSWHSPGPSKAGTGPGLCRVSRQRAFDTLDVPAAAPLIDNAIQARRVATASRSRSSDHRCSVVVAQTTVPPGRYIIPFPTQGLVQIGVWLPAGYIDTLASDRTPT